MAEQQQSQPTEFAMPVQIALVVTLVLAAFSTGAGARGTLMILGAGALFCAGYWLVKGRL